MRINKQFAWVWASQGYGGSVVLFCDLRKWGVGAEYDARNEIAAMTLGVFQLSVKWNREPGAATSERG